MRFVTVAAIAGAVVWVAVGQPVPASGWFLAGGVIGLCVIRQRAGV